MNALRVEETWNEFEAAYHRAKATMLARRAATAEKGAKVQTLSCEQRLADLTEATVVLG